MKDRFFYRVRRLFLFACCAALTLLNGHARAQEEKLIETSAKAAVLIEKNTGRVLYRRNEETALPMASTTKVMTALLALEEGQLDDVVTVSRNAFGVPGTSIYLSEGEKLTLRDLLYGLMLASGNDAAVAIAEHIGGSVDAFCRRMTERAAELGCQNTVFLSPNGLPTPGHHTTAYDLALIAREAIKNNTFRQIISTSRYDLGATDKSEPLAMFNHHKMICANRTRQYLYKNAIGRLRWDIRCSIRQIPSTMRES